MRENISIAAIGTSDSVILFNSIGVKTYVIVKVEEVDRIVFELYKSGCKIIYFDEEIYDNISDVIEKYAYQWKELVNKLVWRKLRIMLKKQSE